MHLFKDIQFSMPVVRVNDKDKNIDFYQKNLGFKLVMEENAIGIFTAWDNATEKFIVEESPAYRTRAVADGQKKVKQIIVKCQKASDIESLLAGGASYTKLYKGQNGYAFESISPQGDVFLLHAETDKNHLTELQSGNFSLSEDFKGLSDFEIEAVILRVPSQEAQAFYQEIFEGNLPLKIRFSVENGEDLQVEPNVTWDLAHEESQPQGHNLNFDNKDKAKRLK